MKHVCTALLLPLASIAQGQTDNCEPIRQHIESRYRAGGVPSPALVVVAAGSAKAGRVVGSCGNGSRQIVFIGTGTGIGTGTSIGTGTGTGATATTSTGTTASPAAPADKIPTECKDGSIVIGPNCDDPRAVRMSAAEIAGSATPPPKPTPTPTPTPP